MLDVVGLAGQGGAASGDDVGRLQHSEVSGLAPEWLATSQPPLFHEWVEGQECAAPTELG